MRSATVLRAPAARTGLDSGDVDDMCCLGREPRGDLGRHPQPAPRRRPTAYLPSPGSAGRAPWRRARRRIPITGGSASCWRSTSPSSSPRTLADVDLLSHPPGVLRRSASATAPRSSPCRRRSRAGRGRHQSRTASSAATPLVGRRGRRLTGAPSASPAPVHTGAASLLGLRRWQPRSPTRGSGPSRPACSWRESHDASRSKTPIGTRAASAAPGCIIGAGRHARHTVFVPDDPERRLGRRSVTYLLPRCPQLFVPGTQVPPRRDGTR